MDNNLSADIYTLLKLGLTEGEAKVYVALLGMDSSSVGPIVKASGVAYSNVYEILERLMKKGIVTYITKSKTRYYQAVSPESLRHFLQKKEQQIAEQKAILESALPGLLQIENPLQRSDAEIYIGTKGLRTAYEKLFTFITPDEDYRFFYIHDKVTGKACDRFYLGLMDLIIMHHPRSYMGICNQAARQSGFNKKFSTKEYKDTVKYLYVNFPIPGNIDIIKDHVLIVAWEKQIVGIMIKSPSIAESLRGYFKSIWTSYA